MDTEELYRKNEILQESNDKFIKELKSFNWGAFGFGWIWGIFNSVYNKHLILFSIIVCVLWIFGILRSLGDLPIIGNPIRIFIIFGPLIYFGIKGNEWAWSTQKWKDIIDFKKAQKKWALWTIILYSVMAIVTVLLISINLYAKNNAYAMYSKYIALKTVSINASGKTSNGSDAAKYIVEHLNSVQNKNVKISLHNSNTVKISQYDKNKLKYTENALYSIIKEDNCSLEKGNCYVAAYKIAHKKPILISKTYFDTFGEIKEINYLKSKK